MSENVIPRVAQYNYKEGDIVKYELLIPGHNIKGTGRIVGVATSWQPGMGCIYMVYDAENFPNNVYPYTTIPMQESALEYLYHIENEFLLISESVNYICPISFESVETSKELNQIKVESFGNNYKAAKKALVVETRRNKSMVHKTVCVLNQIPSEKDLTNLLE